MARIEDTITLIDGVSPTFERIANAAQNYADRITAASRRTQGMADATEASVRRLGGIRDVFAGSFLADIASNAVSSIQGALTGAIALSDRIAGTNARLQMITGSQEEVAALNERIYESAQRAGASYLDLQETVASLSINARDAFPDPAQTVNFVENLQKLFAIGGASAENQKFAMIQLQQALASGRLQGDEFRSITENAPILQEMIAKTMGVTRGELRDLASEGVITADVVKQAVMGNADEIEQRYAVMPKRWSDHMTDMKNTAIHALQPVTDALSKMANSPAVKQAVEGLKSVFVSLAPVALAAVNLIDAGINTIVWAFNGVSEFIQEHSTLMQAGLIAVGIALGLMGAQAFFAASGTIAAAAASGLHAAASIASSAAIFIQIAATEGLTAAFMALNATMFASPLFWIPAAIVLIIGAIYLAVAAINYFAGTSISATGIIFGAFAWLGTNIMNMIKMVANIFVAFANFLGSVFQDPLGAAYNLFVDIWNAIVGFVGEAVNSIIDLVNEIPGMDKVANWDHVSMSTLERKSILNAAFHVQPFEYGNATFNAQQAYNLGANLSLPGLPDLSKAMDPSKQQEAMQNALNNAAGGPLKGIGGNTGRGADEGKRAADALDSSKEDLRYLREIAEREAINKYTTASVTIEMGGMTNNINNEMDVDGVVDVLTEGLLTNMAAGAREVHA